MGNMFSFKVDNTLKKGMEKYFKGVGISKMSTSGADKEAKKKVALSLLNWIINGSAKSSVVPPIKDGILRGSGSVFVGGELILDSKGWYPGGTPNTTYKEHKDVITVGFNTAYAAIQHEKLRPAGPFNLGPRSLQSGDVGGKFVEDHLKADGADLVALYAEFLKKESGG